MRICILTQPLRINYGGLLQSFALQKVLIGMGHDVVTAKHMPLQKRSLWFRLSRFCYHFIRKYLFRKQANPFVYLFTSLDKFRRDYKIISAKTERFIDSNIVTVDFFNENLKTIPKRYDALIVGSDQVWRPIYSNVPTYFLNFTKGMNLKRIAYAASFGVDNIDEFDDLTLKICKDAAKMFDGISVREDSGVCLCNKYLGVKAEHLLDPTMLLDKEDYLKVIDDDTTNTSKVLMCYILDDSYNKDKIVDYFSNKLNLGPLKVMPEEKYTADKTNLTKCVFPSVSSWLAGFRDAKFVVTDSFHGTVFAIIFNKPFVTICNQDRGGARFDSLLKMFKIENRLISSIDDISDDFQMDMDFTEVNAIRKEWKNKSINFLKYNLN